MIRSILLTFVLVTISIASSVNNKTITISNAHSISHEYVYSSRGGKKLSELIWDSGEFSLIGMWFRFTSDSNLIIDFSYKTMLNAQKSQMDDYDWLKNDTNKWSHWSHHDNTILKEFIQYDISIQNELQSTVDDFSHYAIFGYMKEFKIFKAYDGTYIYSSDDGFRDKTGNFYGLGITYSEEYSTLYIGYESR